MAMDSLQKKTMREKQIAWSFIRKKLKNIFWYLFVITVFYVMTVIYEYEQDISLIHISEPTRPY